MIGQTECGKHQSISNPPSTNINIRQHFIHASSFLKDHSIPNETFYEMCSRLNEGQQDLFNYIMKWAMRYQLNKENDEIEPDPFQIFLSGGAGVGKTYLVNVIIEGDSYSFLVKIVMKVHQ